MRKNSGQRNRTKKTIKNFLNHLGLKNFFLYEKKPCDKRYIIVIVYKIISHKCSEIVLKAINKTLMSKDKKGRIDYKVLVQNMGSIFKYSELKKEVTNPAISKSQWSKISNGKSERSSKPFKSPKALSEERKILIKDFWLDQKITRVSPNCMHVLKRKSSKNPTSIVDNVYYRKYTIKRSFQLFQEKYPDVKIGRSTFFKYKPKNVKKSKSKQDYCPLCKEYESYKNYFENHQLSQEENTAKAAFEFHKKIENTRDDDFQRSFENQKDHEAILVMDFKANISLGKGPVEDSHNFFNAPQRTVFGAVCYFKKGESRFKVIFSVISPILMHDTKTVHEILKRHIFSHGVFQHFGITNINFWMDNAPNHFRTKEMLASFVSLEEEFDFSSEINYFAEYHGKSECDRHFGLMSRIYTEHCSYAQNKDINSTEEYVDMYTSYIRDSGGLVLPKIGYVYDEMNLIESGKLNIVPCIFMYPDVSLDDVIIENNKTFGNISFPYTSEVFQEMTKFTFSNFYSFKFTKAGEKKILIAKLHSKSKPQRISFKIRKSTIKNYKLKISVKTASKKKFHSLSRTIHRMKFHSNEYT